LIQAAAALLKLRLGDPRSAVTIWSRGRPRLEDRNAVQVLTSGAKLAISVPIAAIDAAVESGVLPVPAPRVLLG